MAICSLTSLVACPTDEVPRTDDTEKDGEGTGDGGTPPPPDGPSGIDVVIAAPPAYPLGAEVVVDGSGSSQANGHLLTYAWSVEGPAGDGCAPTSGDDALATFAFTPQCEGAHEITLTASTVSGKQETASVTVDVVQVTVTFGDIEPAPRGQSAEVFVTVAKGAIPTGVLTTVLEVTPRAPFTEVPTVTGDGNPFLVPMLDPLATYDLVARVLAGELVVSEADATASVTALNTAPVVSNLRLDPGPFDVGGSTTLLADVVDAEEDDVSCTAAVTAGDDTDFTIAPATALPVAGVCSFTLTAPPRFEQWTLTVTANDGNTTSLPATIDVQPANEPPVLTVSVEGPASAGYACVAPGACASEDFTLVITASDDIDPLEALDIAVTSDPAVLPEGVELVVEPHPSDGDKRLVRFERDDYGPMKGVWPVTVTVTEVTGVDGALGSASQTVELGVTNLGPTPGSGSSESFAHSYDATDGYLSTVVVTVDASDPEGNLLTPDVSVVECPAASAGEPACGGATLTLELLELERDGTTYEARYGLKSETLAALVGTFTFALTFSDPDGASATASATATVTNRPPSVANGARSVNHSYSGGEFHASFADLYVDPDGDPLTVDLTVRCPGGQTIAFGQACSGASPVVSRSGNDVSVSTQGGATSGFLGKYIVRGTLSDTVATIGTSDNTLAELTINNRAPAAPAILHGSSTLQCHHQTTDGTVRNDDDCDFFVEANGSDPDGDPAQIRFRIGDGYVFHELTPLTFRTSNPHTRKFSVETPFTNFKSLQAVAVRGYLEDRFGAQSSETVFGVELLNRAPEWGNNSTITPRKMATSSFGVLETEAIQSATAGGQITYNYVAFNAYDGAGGAYGPKAWGPLGGYSSRMPFTLELDVSDPDGDPLEVAPYVVCTGSPTVRIGNNVMGGGLFVEYAPKLHPYVVFSNALCDSNHVRASVNNFGGNVWGMTCTLSHNLTRATDQIGPNEYMPSSKSRIWVVSSGVEGTCE